MRLRTLISTATAIAVLFSAAALSAHHAFAPEFDGEKMLTLKGVVTKFQMSNPHTFIYLDVTTSDGSVEQWALEGPSIVALNRRALGTTLLKAGDTLDVCGYATKAQSSTWTDTQSGKAMKKLSAELLTLAGGQKVVWSNYGQGKCLS